MLKNTCSGQDAPISQFRVGLVLAALSFSLSGLGTYIHQQFHTNCIKQHTVYQMPSVLHPQIPSCSKDNTYCSKMLTWNNKSNNSVCIHRSSPAQDANFFAWEMQLYHLSCSTMSCMWPSSANLNPFHKIFFFNTSHLKHLKTARGYILNQSRC